MKRALGASALLAVVLLSACGGGGGGSDGSGEPLAEGQTDYPLPESIEAPARVAVPAGARVQRLDRRLRGARGPVEVWVSLDQPSLAERQATMAETAGLAGDRATVQASGEIRKALADQRRIVTAQQADVGTALARLGATELARVNVAHNAIAVRIEAQRLAEASAIPGVLRVRPVQRYRKSLVESLPYVGAAALQAGGLDGRGVKIAVLDSGIDYTHRNLGGAGTPAAYEAAYGVDPADPRTTTRDGLFPTEKVVDGYDFVGETWPNGPRSEDPDPIDLEGHGTHVADIAAGRSADGSHRGVAPGASLVAIKVCSAVDSACDGVAILKGIDYALDPNGDGDLRDAVDVINLSLGSSYGQEEDDSAFAAANAVRAGVVVVAAAGNDANKPYVASSPSTAPGVISVAQTQMPSARRFPLTVNSPASAAGVFANTESLPFAPVGDGVTGDVVYLGRGCPAGSIADDSPDDPYLGAPAGKVALIDRGECGVSLKIDRAAKAGAVAVLIGLVAPGDPIVFSYAGGDRFVPTLVIQQSLAERLRAALAVGAVNVSFSASTSLPVVGGMVDSSARGPAFSTQHIKPEIGAPGASVSAQSGTGAQQTSFGGTSGATPMVAGAAALLLQRHPGFSPLRIKALLMNSAETAVYTDPVLLPGQLAPITRVGAGELRVGRAAALSSMVFDRSTGSAALSFGAVEADRSVVLQRTLRVENFGPAPREFRISPSFRAADDQSSGAVRLLTPGSVSVAPGGHADVTVRLSIDARKLSRWQLDGGSLGGRGDLLDGPEFDGHLVFTDGSERLSVPWHVLPRKAARAVALPPFRLRGRQRVPIVNAGVEASDFEVFSQTGSSPRLPRSELPRPGDAFAVVDLRAAGVRYLPQEVVGVSGGVLEFAVTTQGRRAHPNYPAEFDVDIDLDLDGEAEYAVFNAEEGGFAASGQNVVAVFDYTTEETTVYAFADADLNSGNLVLGVPAAALGIGPGTRFGFSVYAIDNYFVGEPTDSIEGMRFTAGAARYETIGLPWGRVPGRSAAAVPVRRNEVAAQDSSETGLLLLYRRNAGDESDSVRPR